MANTQLLETENLIRSLADELLKLKSAVQQYGETHANLSKIHESLEKIGASSQNLAENTKAFMARLDQINIEGRLEKLREDGLMLMQGQARHAELTIQKISEESSTMRETQARQAELMAQQHMQLSKMLSLTRVLVMASVIAQIATILILVLR